MERHLQTENTDQHMIKTNTKKMMKWFSGWVFYLGTTISAFAGNGHKSIEPSLNLLESAKAYHDISPQEVEFKALYRDLGLAEMKLDYKVFNFAMKGFHKVNPPNKNYLVIHDYSQHSKEKRFYLINLQDKKVEINDYVAHGKNTGLFEAKNFSNTVNSKQTSPGFYLTAAPYFGSNGHSLKLHGLEQGINDRAMERYIVMHGAPYVSDDFVKRHGRVGRSWGCPAISTKHIDDVIGKIKHGALVFNYVDTDEYHQNSHFIKGDGLDI